MVQLFLQYTKSLGLIGCHFLEFPTVCLTVMMFSLAIHPPFLAKGHVKCSCDGVLVENKVNCMHLSLRC